MSLIEAGTEYVAESSSINKSLFFLGKANIFLERRKPQTASKISPVSALAALRSLKSWQQERELLGPEPFCKQGLVNRFLKINWALLIHSTCTADSFWFVCSLDEAPEDGEHIPFRDSKCSPWQLGSMHTKRTTISNKLGCGKKISKQIIHYMFANTLSNNPFILVCVVCSALSQWSQSLRSPNVTQLSWRLTRLLSVHLNGNSQTGLLAGTLRDETNRSEKGVPRKPRWPWLHQRRLLSKVSQPYDSHRRQEVSFGSLQSSGSAPWCGPCFLLSGCWSSLRSKTCPHQQGYRVGCLELNSNIQSIWTLLLSWGRFASWKRVFLCPCRSNQW